MVTEDNKLPGYIAPLVTGVLLRILVLMITISFGSQVSRGFIDSSNNVDDVRYENGAIIYSEIAKAPIDKDAFTTAFLLVGDDTGVAGRSFFNSTPLWYWICSILVYFTHNYIAIRVLNVLLAGLSIVYFYKFIVLISNSRIAKSSAWIMSLSPYCTFFSCFSYKDQMITALVWLLMYLSVSLAIDGRASLLSIAKIFITSFCLIKLRGGFSVLIILVALVILMSYVVGNVDSVARYSNSIKKLLPLFLLVALLLLYLNREILLYKLDYYFMMADNSRTNSSLMRLVTIQSLGEVYKLPATYAVSLLFPLGSFTRDPSWYGIASTINFVHVPIAICSFLYLIKAKRSPIPYWSLIIIYSISVLSGVSIIRHYYSLMPINYYAASEYLDRSDSYSYLIVSLASLVLVPFLILYYLD